MEVLFCCEPVTIRPKEIDLLPCVTCTHRHSEGGRGAGPWFWSEQTSKRDLPELWSEQKLHGFGDPAMNDSWERVQCDAASSVASICT